MAVEFGSFGKWRPKKFDDFPATEGRQVHADHLAVVVPQALSAKERYLLRKKGAQPGSSGRVPMVVGIAGPAAGAPAAPQCLG